MHRKCETIIGLQFHLSVREICWSQVVCQNQSSEFPWNIRYQPNSFTKIKTWARVFLFFHVRAEKRQVYMLELSDVGFVTEISALISRRPFVFAPIESKFFSWSIYSRSAILFQERLFCNMQNSKRTQLIRQHSCVCMRVRACVFEFLNFY